MRLRIVDMSVKYGAVEVLRDVSLEVPSGSFTALIGPNGSGKSTLLHQIAEPSRRATSRIQLADLDLSRLTARERARRVAFVEQESVSGHDVTVRDVIELGRTPWRRGLHFEPVADPVVDDAARTAGVDDLLDRPWQDLSGGERQRAHLARALAQEPTLLVLDEPTNHLDVRHQIDFLDRVRRLPMTVFAAMHDLALVGAFCDHVVVLHEGQVAAAGRTADVLTSQLIHEVFGVAATVRSVGDAVRIEVDFRAMNAVESPVR
ncbi:ATP-binding cassette domain-containing protein [Epidermidibacterium keratini]|uniref:ATP-binding cassette domain-containing protein n=1 Tax=Epidermidibacterium keratini TaxID=1891644 RepID=A0A7L4YPH0_9ACTN|nr:ABC transporter ATP-binding protein [Epidermidibacterium keratini]QHC01020.1 ATP-binding cassette domain-containing protein [Epidermidibacterium keratini]